MASPPPPPTHHGVYGTPRYETRTPSSQGSYDRNDLADRLAGLGMRDAARSPSSRTTRSSLSTSPSKDYRFFTVKRDGSDWYDARLQELSVPQGDLKKRAEKSTGKISDQLKKLGNGRRQHIADLITELDSKEADGMYWEPAHIVDTEKVRDRQGVVRIRAFDIVLARKARAAQQAPKEAAPKAKTDKKPVPVLSINTSPPKAAKKNGYMDDPFSSTTLFARDGAPMDALGSIPFENAGLPSYIGPDKPIAQGHRQEQPPAEPVVPELLPGLGDEPNLDAFLKGLQAGEPGAILDVPNHRSSRAGVQDRHNRTRPRSLSRRRSSAHRSHDGGPFVRFETRSPDEPRYASSRSSWASDDASVMFGELDESSSRASGDSGRSQQSPRKYVINPPYRRSDRSPRKSKYYNLDKIITTEGRRRAPAAIEPAPKHKSVSPKPLVHQQAPPQRPSQQVPPIAEYPAYYQDREREQERVVDDYIRSSAREQDLRAHEEELAQRERMVRLKEIQAQEQEQRRSMFSPTRAFTPTLGTRRYSYEPRNYRG